jgi:putative transposase
VRLEKSAHTVYKTQYHIVWITRYRRKILVEGIKDYLKLKLQETRKYHFDWEYMEIGIDCDHVHLYMVIPPKYAVSEVVEVIKKNTSKSLSEEFFLLG